MFEYYRSMFFNRNTFRDDFCHFLSEHGFVYKETDERLFILSDHKVAIVLVFLADFKILSGADGLYEPFAEWGNEFKRIAADMDIVYLYEDRWFFNKELTKKRILARLGVFVSVFARKCTVIEDAAIKADSRKNTLIREFLNKNHSYGDAMCKYRYALEYNGEIVAVATFSASRPMMRNGVVYDSYEWVRYASLPDCRVVGGMGRLLRQFVKDAVHKQVRPVEIMSYSDIEWSQGGVYETLGFALVQHRKAVEFFVNADTFERVAANKIPQQKNLWGKYGYDQCLLDSNLVKIKNLGSNKYLYYPTL